MGKPQESSKPSVENECDKSILNAIHQVQAIIEFDLDGNVLDANQNFLDALGYSIDEVKGQHHRMFCEESYYSSPNYQRFWKTIASGDFQSGEYKRIRKDGSEIWILASYNLVYDSNGKPYKAIKFATDITDQKLRSTDLEGKNCAIHKTQAIIEFDLDGHVLTANENFLNTVGYTLDEIKGKHHAMFCEKSYTESAEYEKFWSDLRQGNSNADEYKRLDKQGNDIWINASYNPIIDSEGNTLKIVKFATNITESKLKNALFEGKIDAIGRSQAVIEFDLDGNILSANENFLTTLGYTADEIVGQHHRIFCEASYTRTEEYSEFWKCLKGGNFNQGEYKRLKKDGSEIWINASYNPIFDASGNPYRVVKFASNITAQKVASLEHESMISAIDRAQAIIEFTPKGDILKANAMFLAGTGYLAEELKGKHHRIFCDDEYTSSGEYKQFWKDLENGQFESDRYKRFTKSGATLWLQATYNPIFDLNGNVSKVVKLATDITAQVSIEESVTSIAESFVANTTEIASQANDVSDGAQTLGATTEQMNASVEELSASIDSIAENSRQADAVAKNTQKEADLGTKAIERSIESMELINQSSEEIAEIVKVISEIASQTNLLAFNAAIEAARAGEHGLGFSVVADEVRKLAERSSQATKEITKLINESVKRIVQGGEISKEAATAFGKIVEGVSKTTYSISEISTAAHEQQTAAHDVSDAIQQIASATETSAVASESIASATNSLLGGAHDLKSEIQKFSGEEA